MLDAWKDPPGLAASTAAVLTREEVTDGIAELLGVPASARLVGEVWELGGGSPTVTRAVVEAGLARGAIQLESEMAQLIAPLALDAEQVSALPMMETLDDHGRAALLRLALIEPAPLALAGQLVDAGALTALMAAGLAQRIPPLGARPEAVWIPAQAIADRLRADAAPAVRDRVHAAVLASPPARPGPWQAFGRSRSLLWWYRQGEGGVPQLPPADAARAANLTHLWDVADELCTHALAAGFDPRLLRERAHARRFGGDPGGALEDLSRLRSLGDDGTATAIGIADLLHYEHGDAGEAIRFLSAAADEAEPGTARRELEGATVAHLAYAGRFEACEDAHLELRPGPLRERGRADIAHAMAWSHRGKTVQALRRLYKYQLMPTAETPTWFTEELQGALFVCMLQAHGPRRTLTATKILGATEANPFIGFDHATVLTARASVLLMQGHAQEAYRLALSIEAGSEHDRSGFGAHALALGAEAAAYLGDADASRRLEARFRETPPRAAGILHPNSETALCAAALILGDRGAAERARGRAAEFANAGLHAAALRVAQAGLRLGDAGCAELAARLGEATTGEVCAVFAAHGSALAAADPHRLMRVAEEYLRLGFTLHAAETFCQTAVGADEAGVSEIATEALSRARMLLSLTDARAPHLAAAGQAPIELSRREREIALLVSQGASNRSIAQALVISVRTVEGHLGRMYGKLGVSGRRELAGHLRRAELHLG